MHDEFHNNMKMKDIAAFLPGDEKVIYIDHLFLYHTLTIAKLNNVDSPKIANRESEIDQPE